MKPKLSVVISAYNEDKIIGRTLKALAWTDEIVLINNNSTDETAKIAQKYTSHIYSRPNQLMLNKNKNFGFSKATGDWILCLDADEEVTPELASEIRTSINAASKEIAGFWLPRKNIIFGKWIKHGLWWPDRQLRLFRRGAGKFAEKHVHEYLNVDGKTEHLTEPFVHYNYSSISQFIHKMDSIYTENEVENLLSTGYVASWKDAIKFPVSDFVKVYFAQAGWQDGLHGLVLALLQAFYSLVVFAKLWERSRFEEKDITLNAVSGELMYAGREINYWRLTSLLQETKSFIKRIHLRVQRKLSL